MSEQRKDERVLVSISGTMVADRYLTSVVTLRDLSASGCRVSCAPLPRIGSRIQLQLSAAPNIQASVIWSTLSEAGLWFPEGLPMSELRRLRKSDHGDTVRRETRRLPLS